MARKIITIGECILNVEFCNGVPVKAFPGGRILNVATMLGRCGYDVEMVGECGQDRMGDLIIEALTENNVSTRSIDRFTEGLTPSRYIFNDAPSVYYQQFSEQEFDFVWPSLERDDIVVFGSFFAVSQRVRARVYELLQYASERGAIIIYLPGFAPQRAPRITKQMPAIFENLELADMVVCRNNDLKYIFGGDNEADVFNRHISFYSSNFVNINEAEGVITHRHAKDVDEATLPPTADLLHYNVAIVASIVKQIIDENLTRESLHEVSLSSITKVLENNQN